MKKMLTAFRALIYMIAFVYLWAVIALSVRQFDAKLGLLLPEGLIPVGVVLMAVGGILGLVCVGMFVFRGEGTAAPFDAPRRFVAVGPYRYVRNPMYIGGWIMLIGFSLFHLSASMFLFSFLWLILAHLFVILYEEQVLARRFGQSYQSYKVSVRRWVPKLPQSML
jgi:protein-S-isoprenylcysteine O-methyltransferase Ste14